MANFKGLAHIGIFTGDIEKSKSFYIEKLGCKLKYETIMDKPDNQWLKMAFIDLNGMVIELLEPSDKTTLKTGSDGSVNHIAIEVKGLKVLVEELKAKGVDFETEESVTREKLFNGAQMIFFKGPSGERLELFEFLG